MRGVIFEDDINDVETPMLLVDAEAGIVPFVSEVGWASDVSCVTSRCRGDEWIGELESLLCVSPLPPREELRGETRPVYQR